MEKSQSDDLASVDHKVPDELLQKLHLANQQFHQAKQHLEQVMADSEYKHLDRIEQATQQVRTAELEVERVTAEIEASKQWMIDNA